VDHAVAPVRALLRVPVPDLVRAVARDPVPAPDPEAKAAAVQDLVDVPRASLALPENRVPSPGRALGVTVTGPSHVTSLTIAIAPSRATSRLSAIESATAATATHPSRVRAPSQWPSRITDPDHDPNLAASPGTSQDRVHTLDRFRAAGARVRRADRKRRTSRWRMETVAAPKMKVAMTE